MGPLTGVILAGGRASRFDGKSKGLELVGGRRIIDRVADALLAACDHLLIISDDPEAQEWVPRAVVRGDILPSRASATGLHAALSHAGGAAIVAGWDMPFIAPALIRLLADRLEADVDAVVPAPGGRLEPLCAAYGATAFPFVDEAVRSGMLRLADIVNAIPRVRLLDHSGLEQLGDPAIMFSNVNTAADLAAAREHAARL